jgi:hypothetical protein
MHLAVDLVAKIAGKALVGRCGHMQNTLFSGNFDSSAIFETSS